MKATHAIAPTRPTARSSLPSSASPRSWSRGRLRHKCACGGDASVLTGECGECRRQKGLALPTKLKVNEPGNVYEREADRITDQVMNGTPSSRRAVNNVPSRIQRFSSSSGRPGRRTGVAAPSGSVNQALVGPGRPLEPALRQDMERRFDYDFSRVRVHSDLAAEQSAREIHAQAYTVGHHLVFRAGKFAPETHEGRRLLAHELTHVVQQEHASSDVLQRKDENAAPLTVGANDILPYPVGARVQVTSLIQNRVLDLAATFTDEYQDLIAAIRDEDVVKSIVATVTESSAEKVLASIDIPPMPAKGSRPALAAIHVDLEVERQSDGTFDCQILWSGGRRGREAQFGITATKEPSGRIVLSKGGSDLHAVIGPAQKGGERVVTAENLPTLARFALGDPVKLLSMKELKSAAGSAEEKKEIAQTATAARATVAEKRQQLSLGLGAQHGFQFDPALTTGWQFTFSPLAKALQVPVAVQLNYVPPKSLLVGASVGLQTTIPTKIPVELHVFRLGVKGGAVAQGGSDVSRADRELTPVLGPSFGTGVGFDLGTLTVQMDVEHLQNLLKGPNVQTVTLGAALHF